VVAPASLWFPRVVGLAAGSLTPDSTVKTLRDRGLSFETSFEGGAPALFIMVAGDDGPELRVGFHNLGVLTRYNHSVLYALAVHDLGSRIQALLPAAN
jgi:membrane-bound lytic murein transglycosylase B